MVSDCVIYGIIPHDAMMTLQFANPANHLIKLGGHLNLLYPRIMLKVVGRNELEAGHTALHIRDFLDVLDPDAALGANSVDTVFFNFPDTVDLFRCFRW